MVVVVTEEGVEHALNLSVRRVLVAVGEARQKRQRAPGRGLDQPATEIEQKTQRIEQQIHVAAE